MRRRKGWRTRSDRITSAHYNLTDFFCRRKKRWLHCFRWRRQIYFWWYMLTTHELVWVPIQFSTHVFKELTVRVRLKKFNLHRIEYEDVCSPPLSVCYWSSSNVFCQTFKLLKRNNNNRKSCLNLGSLTVTNWSLGKRKGKKVWNENMSQGKNSVKGTSLIFFRKPYNAIHSFVGC